MMNPLEEFSSLIGSKAKVLQALLQLFKLESRLSGLKLMSVLLNLVMMLVIAFTIYLSSMFLVGYGVYLYFNSLILTFVAILILNAIVFKILLSCLSTNLKLMSFEKTRKFLSGSENDEENKKLTSDDSQS